MSAARRLLGAVWACALVAAAATTACPPNAVQRRIASSAAIVANAAEPLWIAAYRAEGRAAADRAGASPENRLAAVRAVRDRWLPVRDAWEALRAAHDAWADALDACGLGDAGADSGACPPSLAGLAAAYGDATGAWRCAVRAAGHPELDPVRAPPSRCPSVEPDHAGDD